jgi:MFS family permease
VSRWVDVAIGIEDPIARRNFAANVMDGACFAFGMSFVSQQAILPVFVKAIGGGNIAVGLIPVLWTFGFNFPQVIIARNAQRTTEKKKLLLQTAMGQRIPWFLLALIPLVLAGAVGTGGTLAAFFVLYALAAIGGSINLPVWFDLIAKLTPVNVRGRLFAIRSVLGSALGIGGGAIAVFVLGTISSPQGFALLFFLAFASMMASYYFLMRLKETAPEGPTPSVPQMRLTEALPRIMRTGKNYRHYLIGDALLMCSTMANGFFAVYAITKFSLPDAAAGAFTMVIAGSTIFGSLVFGFLADRRGHRLNMLLAGMFTFLACVSALVAPSPAWYAVAFVCSASSVALGGISRLPLIAELCAPEERPTYIALSNMVTSPFVLFGIVGGWIANAFGFSTLLIIAGTVALAAVLWWLTMVDEPRRPRAVGMAS